MKVLNGLLFIAMLSASTLFGNDAEHGKELYFEGKCQECHNQSDYTSADRKVKNYAKLQSRVKSCEETMQPGWFEEDTADVVHYLNDSFYKFNTETSE
jgi:hypothetical protein